MYDNLHLIHCPGKQFDVLWFLYFVLYNP